MAPPAISVSGKSFCEIRAFRIRIGSGRERKKKTLRFLPSGYNIFSVLGGTAGHLGARRGGLHFFCPDSKARAWHAERLESR